MTIEFKFATGHTVTIAPNGLTGKVVGLYVDQDGIKMANVQYSDSSRAVHCEYFRESELS